MLALLIPVAFAAPPDPPALVSPAEGATEQLLAPTLSVQVSDPDGDALEVRFEGRAAGAPGEPFTVIAVPDTQYYACDCNGGDAALMKAQTDWVVDELVSRNIVYVAQLGDCTENGDEDEAEWLRADAAWSVLEDPTATGLADGLPYGISVGNHDQTPAGDPDGDTTLLYNAWFGVDRFDARPWYGGHLGDNNDNHVQLFEAGALGFVVVHLEFDETPDADVLEWAAGVLAAYPDRLAIVVSHYFLRPSGDFGTQGQATFDALRDQPNLRLMLSGHVPGEGQRTEHLDSHSVTALLSNYQSRSNGGDGWLRILTFDPAANQVKIETYSPSLDAYETDADSAFTLEMTLDAAPWTHVQTHSVADGDTAEATWAGLAPNTAYEWRVVLSDGESTTEGPIWGFWTGTGDADTGDGGDGADGGSGGDGGPGGDGGSGGEGGSNDPEEVAAPEVSTCGCGTAGGGLWAGLLAGLGWVRRRGPVPRASEPHGPAQGRHVQTSPQMGRQ